MNYSFLFHGIDSLSKEEIATLSERVAKRIEYAVQEATEPFESNAFLDAGATKVTLEGFPSGGYASKEQATIAVALWRVKPSMLYAELYTMSNFIVKGLN